MRQTLPNRRLSETVEFRHDNLNFTGTVGYRMEEGSLILGEIFLDVGKAGSMASILASDGAIAASLAVQYQCPIDVLRNALLRHEDGTPASPMSAFFDELARKGGR